MTETASTNSLFFDLEKIEISEEEFSDKEIEFLERINKKVISSHSLDEVMNFLFDSSIEVFPCDRISLAFVKDAGRRMETFWTRAKYEPVLLEKGYSAELDKTSLREMLEQGGARINNDLEEYFKFNPNSETTQLLIEEGAKSTFAYPVSVGKHKVGFIFRSCREKNAYNEHLVKLQYAVSVRLTQAIEKAYQLQQLAEANMAYLELLSFVAHELKSPLASIILDSKLLIDDYAGPMSNEQKEKMNLIVNRATYLMDLVKDYLDLARIEGGNLKMNIIDEVNFVKDILKPCIDIIYPQMHQKNMQIDIEEPETPLNIQCDPELLRIAVLNLLDNAVKYGNENGSVAVLLKQTHKGIVFSVWNEGPGFPEKEQSRLFRRFSRLNTKQLIKKKGTGLGLYTSWRIIRLHGGSIEARSEEGLWAEFTLRIPQPVQAKTYFFD